jgi:hypothetical protein
MIRSTSDRGPTARQLRYLALLAEQTETSFGYPVTRSDASREIARLRKLKDTTEIPVREGAEVEDERLRYATAPQPGEISGYGSTATWATLSLTQPR